MKIKAFFIISFLAIFGCSANSFKQAKLQEGQPKPNEFWWPNQVDLSPLRDHSANSSPLDKSFNYEKEYKKLNIVAVKRDIETVMTTSQDWWPADFGNYGPLFIRMAWHSAGTYRVSDGRGGADGGQQRFEPLNSWPDNANLDKARRLLWPVKRKYGSKISWADLMILSGNVALESMGFKTYGFAGGRIDDWEADLVYWGPEKEFLASKRHDKKGKLDKPFGATTMGLIYVNPEGPNGNADPLAAAERIRQTFGQMAMNDEETVALIAGGHTFGKMHGAFKAAKCVGVEPAGAAIEEQGMGWKNKCGSGKGIDTVTSGLEGAWTSAPTKWTHQYLNNLFNFEWKKTKSPGGATQWIPKDEKAADLVPDAHDPNKRHAPIMLTTDLSLKFDPEYRKIAKRFQENPKEFELAFAKAWFKLTHRDMGPKARYFGKNFPRKGMLWQDPIPPVKHKLINKEEIAALKKQILKSGLTRAELVKTAWASAASFRSSDMRGGANGAHIRLAPQKDWAVNDPAELSRALKILSKVQRNFNRTLTKGKRVSLADVIVLGGGAAIEKAAAKAGIWVRVPFKPGRADALQRQTDIESFANLELKADGFRNYYNEESRLSPVNSLIDRADMLNLTIPEMTVLIGGMRVLDANSNHSKHGVFTKKPEVLSNDFFVNLLDMSTKWSKSDEIEGVYEGRCRKTGRLKWTATSVDLIFGSNSELRAIAEFYAADGYQAKKKFVNDFVKAWTKVMRLDRFDL